MSSALNIPDATALTIAGSDPSGGAGLQADLKAFAHFDVYGMTAITGLTVGNTKGVTDVKPLDPDFIRKQYQSVVEDIEPAAVKMGMLFHKEIIRTLADALTHLSCPVVVDPVMVTKRGDVLLPTQAQSFYVEHLLRPSHIITPNIPEAELLTNETIDSNADVQKAARRLVDMGCRAVIIKGGHREGSDQSDDLLFDGEEMIYLRSKRYDTPHTHGAGDAFSAAITALLAKQSSIHSAAQQAKQYISRAIEDAPGLGEGQGPVNLFA